MNLEECNLKFYQTCSRIEDTLNTSDPLDTEFLIPPSTIYWDAVPEARGYRIYVNGERETETFIFDTTFDLMTLDLPVGTHYIQVRAVGWGEVWSASK